ncbi:S26 family signal peptidase [Singulisphaera sp. PoT]|uniref:S26 family signal peptidase n=1 Tax=Singulisphaera sp. PoT TaxID=3411797 RepID=UPI003BF5AA1F
MLSENQPSDSAPGLNRGEPRAKAQDRPHARVATAMTMSLANEVKSETVIPNPATGFVRQVVEFLVVMTLGILLFRTFAAEAYIVPTGSMAPTLLGMHEELVCPNCQIQFNLGLDEGGRSGRPICPNCGQNGLENYPALECSGDRLLVQKFLYDFRPPRRWEVAVFHFPGDPSQAYVKRVVGLPNERVQIVHGDIVVDGTIARKTLEEQRAMRILVYDNQFVPRDSSRFPRFIFRRGRPRENLPSGWKASGGRFSHEALADPTYSGPGDWLEYRHWDPDRGRYAPVYDFSSYNGGELRGENRITDLMVEARLRPGPDLDAFDFRINSGADRFLITIPTRKTSTAVPLPTVRRNGVALPLGHALTLAQAAEDASSILLEVSAMDQRLLVAVDGKLLFDPIDYDSPNRGPGGDESPFGIGVRSGTLDVESVRLFRDVYYTSELANTPQRPFAVDRPYPLGPDEFFVLGDNSPVSNDSRFWPDSPVVRTELLLGKPFLVHLPGQVVPLEVFGRSVYWVPDPRKIRYIR